MNMKEQLLSLPGTPQEEAWLLERMETLSANERIVLTAALQRKPPSNRADAINHMFSLPKYNVIPSIGNYHQLGEYYANDCELPEEALPYMDMNKLGCFYVSRHPGQFVWGCYVVYPPEPPTPVYDGNGIAIPEDKSWSVKLKLASPNCPEGVWLRMLDYSKLGLVYLTEVELALYALHVKSLEECTLLEAKCILPEAGNLMEQYDNITELVDSGDALGYEMGLQIYEVEHGMEKFAAALKYEDCHTLRLALDIARNLDCYEWKSCEEMAELAANHLRGEGVSAEVIQSGCINLDEYAADLLESSGFVLAHDKTGYIARNNVEFIWRYAAPDGAGMTMQ